MLHFVGCGLVIIYLAKQFRLFCLLAVSYLRPSVHKTETLVFFQQPWITLYLTVLESIVPLYAFPDFGSSFSFIPPHGPHPHPPLPPKSMHNYTDQRAAILLSGNYHMLYNLIFKFVFVYVFVVFAFVIYYLARIWLE